MVRYHLSRMMGEHKMKVSDVARATGLNRNMVTLRYNETASRVELEAIEKFCDLFKCEVGDLLELASEQKQ